MKNFDYEENDYVLLKLILKMKLTVFILLLCFSVTYATDAVSQVAKVTINKDNATVLQVMDAIETQTDYLFVYNKSEVNESRAVSVNVKDISVAEVLNLMFRETGVIYAMEGNNIMLMAGPAPVMTEQQKSVSGKVTDATGQPLPGVTVVVKGTTTGTITDASGMYTLGNLPENATLIFSFVGMRTQEVVVGNQAAINITMEEETVGIEEVVAIGYGTMRKSDLTGSVTRANIEKFRESPNVSLAQSLQGTVPGLNIGQVNTAGEEPSLSIRGITTISGTDNPLIIVDGVIFRGSLIDLNSKDVESVDVLKDASSTAIYGSQAANGVILITTKRGQTGKSKVSYSGNISFSEPTNILQPVNREYRLKRIYDADWARSRLAPDFITPNPNWDIYQAFIDQPMVSGYNDGTDTDWYSLLTQNSHMQNHNIDLSGGKDGFSYYSSVGYTDQAGWLLKEGYKRYNARINIDNKVNDWLSIGLQSFITTSDYSGVTPGTGSIYMDPLYRAFDDNGEPILLYDGQRLNPLLGHLVDDLNKRMNLFGLATARVDFPFVKGLSYKFLSSANYIHNKHYYFSEYASNYQGLGYKEHGISNEWTMDNQLSYVRQFYGKHRINATFVYGRERRYFESTNSRSSIFDNMILGYNSLQSGDIIQQAVTTSAWEENSLYSMARVFYGFKDKYLITGTIRRDGFSGFGENHKFGLFPSAAFGWVPTEESFFPESRWLNYLKIRTSYGTNGNRTVGRYETQARVDQEISYVYGDGNSPVIGQWISKLPNYDLKWETTTGLNLGADFRLLQDRLVGSFDYYSTVTNDMLYNIQIPELTGFSSIASNIGEIRNHGAEITLTSVNINNRDWNWQTTLNFSMNRNKVVTILGIDDDEDGREDNLIASNIFIGEPLGVLYGFERIGMYQIGDNIPNGFYPGTYILKDVNEDGKITPDADKKILGYTDPGSRLSFQSSLNYKNWALNVFINSIQGGKNYYYAFNGSNLSTWNGPLTKAFQNSSGYFDYWTPENPNAKHEQLGTRPNYEVFLPEQRNFVRLQDVSLSYKFKTNFDLDGKIFLSGKNLYTWTKWEGWDPETGIGLRSGRPVMKTYSVGIEVTF